MPRYSNVVAIVIFSVQSVRWSFCLRSALDMDINFIRVTYSSVLFLFLCFYLSFFLISYSFVIIFMRVIEDYFIFFINRMHSLLSLVAI